VGAELAAPVAADAWLTGLFEEATGGGRIGPAEVVATQVGPVDELLTSGSQAHRGTVAPGRRRAGPNRRYAGPMADDTRGSGLSTTSVVLLVVGVLVAGWFLLGLVHFVVGLVWTLAEVAVVALVLVLVVRFLLGRSKSD